MTNSERVARARRAVMTYTGKDLFDAEDHVPDLICDLLHYARESGLEIDSVLRSAISNFVAERLGPDDSLGPHVQTTVKFM